MFESLTSNQVIAVATLGIFLVGLGQLYLKRVELTNRDSAGNIPSPTLFSTAEPQTIHAISGVPTLQQLIEDIELDTRRMGVAERLYESGLAQFNRYVNNRDGVTKDSHVEMANLAPSLSGSDLSLAESVGIELATSTSREERAAAQARYDRLGPPAQIYAQHKRRELEAMSTIARDLEKDIPRTDYTLVKALIATGNVKLDSIMSELPIPWQSLRTLNGTVDRPRITEKPPPRKFLHVIFHTQRNKDC